MPSTATSLASVRAKPVTAARTEFERMRLSTGCFTAMDVTLTMRPHRRSRMPGSTRRVRLSTLSRFCRIASRQTSAECARKGPAGGPPVFVTSTSTPPQRSVAALTTRSTPSGSVRSAATATTSAPAASSAAAVSRSGASRRAQMTSRAPSAASSSAIARPSPRLAAATRARLPRSPRSIGYFRWK